MRRAATPQQPRDAAPQSGAGSSSLRILVVSDDPLVRDEARYGFPARVEVSFAVDAREGARRLADDGFSVVVVDMQTGNAGGYSLAHEMTESPRLANIPVLILLERAQDAWLARQAGATAHCTKPLGAGRLAQAVLSLTS